MLYNSFQNGGTSSKKRFKSNAEMNQHSNYYSSNQQNNTQFNETDGDTGYEEDLGKCFDWVFQMFISNQ